jgi:MarR family transcriptional regulator, organic hydroperoxide resistance regulator
MTRFNLQEYVPYLLNRCAIRGVETFVGDLRAASITLPMWRALAALRHGGSMRLGELAEMTSIEMSTLSRTVAAMNRKSLLSRTRSSSDARAVQVTLTPEGLALTERLIPAALRCEAAALDGFTGAEVELLRSLLRRLYGNLQSGAAAPAEAAHSSERRTGS